MTGSLLGRTHTRLTTSLVANHYHRLYIHTRPHALRQHDTNVVLNSPKPVRHILRGLLRECTYLPDLQARQWMKGYIVQRYRRSLSTKTSSRDPTSRASIKTPSPGNLDGQRRTDAVSEARQGLGQLQRANRGDLKLMLKVVGMTYGRTGRRRHELLKPLLKDAGDKQSDSPNYITTTEAANETDRQNHPISPLLTPPLHALLFSQSQTSLPSLFRSTLRSIIPSIPAENSWHRPMPLKRFRNAEKKWYAHTLERVHPPLPTEEWESLRGLATRTAILEPVQPPRRTPVVQANPSDDGEGPSVLEAVVMKGKPRLPALGHEKSNQLGRIDSRSMRRLWRKVFAACPRMDWDGDKQRWEVRWGAKELAEAEREKVVGGKSKKGG